MSGGPPDAVPAEPSPGLTARLLNGRDPWLVTRNLVRLENYTAMARMLRVYPRPFDMAARYLFGSGTYPCRVAVRSPAGKIELTAYHGHDITTVQEIFGRVDYACPTDARLVVDIGSNIGVSALYFLTRAPASRCILYEPDPRNVPKLRANLAPFSDRFELHEVAVADREGELPFTIEQYGRYGGLDAAGTESITVRVEHINSVLEDALRNEDVIDVLKIDTEGSELATVKAIRPDLLRKIRRVYFESFDGLIELPGFETSESCDTIRLDNTALRPR